MESKTKRYNKAQATPDGYTRIGVHGRCYSCGSYRKYADENGNCCKCVMNDWERRERDRPFSFYPIDATELKYQNKQKFCDILDQIWEGKIY